MSLNASLLWGRRLFIIQWGFFCCWFKIHLCKWLILLIRIFSAVLGFSSALLVAGGNQIFCLFCKEKKLFHLLLMTELHEYVSCSSSVGSVYLLCRVEAPEAVGDTGGRHLDKPPNVQAWGQRGSMALYLLHVCPRWVSTGRDFETP